MRFHFCFIILFIIGVTFQKKIRKFIICRIDETDRISPANGRSDCKYVTKTRGIILSFIKIKGCLFKSLFFVKSAVFYVEIAEFIGCSVEKNESFFLYKMKYLLFLHKITSFWARKKLKIHKKLLKKLFHFPANDGNIDTAKDIR